MPTKVDDGKGKRILREHWPRSIQALWEHRRGGFWLRGQPPDGGPPGPTIREVGSQNETQPDGLYVYLDRVRRYADTIAIEICGTQQNFVDKRARYVPSAVGREVVLSHAWLNYEITLRGRRRSARWMAAAPGATPPSADDAVTIRHLRTLFALPNDLYRAWGKSNVLHAHEYVMPHSSLASYTRPEMQEFLRALSVWSHYYIDPSRA